MAGPINNTLNFTDDDLVERVPRNGEEPIELLPSTQMARTRKPTLCQADFEFPGGDIRIRVSRKDDTTFEGKVCSQSMGLGGPVFKNMVFKPSENENEPPKVVDELDFTEDDAATLLIILNIIHLKFRSVPRRELSYRKLLAMAQICDKYNCVPLVELFLSGWLDGEDYEPNYDNRENWLYIAYVFGRDETFATLAVNMVKNATVGEDQLLTRTSKMFVDPMPEGILESIKTTRAAVIQALLDVWYEYTNSYMDKYTTICKEGNKKCDAMAWGSIVFALKDQGLWPEKKATDISMSINELASNLLSLQVITFDRKGHRKCLKTNINDKIETVLKEIPSPVLNVHEKHMDDISSLLDGDTDSEPEYEKLSDCDFEYE
ncbi:hypothetical protein HYFRA_00004632 [Hymenoscyphus fraxineus]|uniref:BTB domain-containing protein n=1 Tax=Hymenoscyphus fraxineus TaxID=746836 RepID=A0A9N9PIP3_9HELO|nr:hypothetical protein HYFRA_00004632 [Hymenoscyphus fraxineus]